MPSITVDGGNWAGADETAPVTLTELRWNIPTTGQWNIFEIRVNGTTITDASLITFGSSIVDGPNLTDGNPDTAIVAYGGADSSIVVDVSGFNPITSIQIKDYGDGPYWQGYQSNGKGEWLAFNDATEVILPIADDDGYVFHDRYGSDGQTDISKTVAYSTKLTVASDKDLDVITGGIYMTDGTPKQDGSGELKPASYTPQTSEIANVVSENYSSGFSANYYANTFPFEGPADDIIGSDGYIKRIAYNPNETGMWTAPTGGVGTTSVRVDTYFYENTSFRVVGGGRDVTINPQMSVVGIDESFDGGNITTTIYSVGINVDETYVTITGSLLPVEKIEVLTTEPTRASYFKPIYVDGVRLIDDLTQLTFNTPNPDLQYFQPGDQLGTPSGFASVIYTGNGGAQSITGVGFSPDFVWTKDRGTAHSHALFDTVRGATKGLHSDLLQSQWQDPSTLTAFDSDGFTLGGHQVTNTSSNTYVAWCWDAGGTTVTNNDGTIESQVRSNGNFSVVTFTNAEGLVGHGLSSPPKFIITKTLDQDYTWSTYHSSLGKDKYIALNFDNPAYPVGGMWGSSEPTNSVFGTTVSVAPIGASMVTYAWADAPGVSSFGEYDGNGTTTGPVIDCGFAPEFVMIKCSTRAGTDWMIYDSVRDTASLSPNTSSSEASGLVIEFTPNGFQPKVLNDTVNSGEDSYIYAAFANHNSINIVDVDVDNNQMTVDGGEWVGTDGSGGDGRYLPDQQWSASYTSSGGWYDADSTATKSFDGNLNTYSTSTDIGDSTTFTLSTGIPYTQNVEVITGFNGGTVSFNGSGSFTTVGDVWVEIASGSGTFTSFTITSTASNRSTLAGVRVDGKLLVDSSVPGAGETKITGSTETAEGTILEIKGTEVDLSASSGRWIADNKAGIPFSFVPSTPIVDTTTEAYGKLQIINDKAQVTGIQATDPGFLNVTAKDYSIQFPSVFATGNAPDVDLPAGCSISAIVKAENGAGASVKESNVLLPQIPNPEGTAGPITDVEGGGENVYTTDTIASVASTDYSSLATTSDGNGFRPANPPSNAFDGNESTSCLSLNEGKNISLIFPLNISNVNKLEVRPVATGSTVTMNAGADDATHSANNSWVEVPVPANGEVVNLTVKRSTSNAGIYGIKVNDVVLIEGNTTLTFPTDNNFDEFEVGDVVQGVDTAGTESGVANPGYSWGDFWAAKDNTGSQTVSGGLYGDGPKWTFNTPINLNSLVVNQNKGQGCTTAELIIETADGERRVTCTNPSGSAKPDFSTSQFIFSNVVGMTSIKASLIAGPDCVSPAQIFFDGVPFNEVASITAIDDTVPSITVAGGSWYGQDGSGDVGNPAWYEPSQEWSANPTNVLSTNVPYGFDNTNAYTSTDGAVTEAYYTFNPPINNVDNISVYQGNATWNSAYSFFVEETDGTRTSSNLTGQATGVNLGGNASVVKIGVLSNGAAAIMNMWAIAKVDGVTLVDSSIPGGQGATDITKTVVYDSKLTVGTDANLETFIAADALVMVDYTGAVASYSPETSAITAISPSPDLAAVPSELAWNGYVGSAWSSTQTWDALTVVDVGSNGGNNGVGKSSGVKNITTPFTFPNNGTINDWNVAYSGSDGWAIKFDRVVTCKFVVRSDLAGTTTITAVTNTSDQKNSGTTVTATADGVTLTGQVFWYDFTSGDPAIDGMGIIEKADLTQLTLTDNQDFKNLKAGDKVEAVPVSSYALSPAFTTTLYTGNDGTNPVETGIDNTGKALVWVKGRNGGYDHILKDTENGPTYRGKTNSADAWANVTNGSGLLEFTDNGYTQQSSNAQENLAGVNYAVWNFRAAPGFMDIVTWDGNSVPNTGIPHSLGSTPGCIIAKPTSKSDDWYVYHKDSSVAWTGGETAGDGSGGNKTGCMILNQSVSFEANKSVFTYVNDQKFGVFYSNANLNESGQTNVAYLFADTPDVIKCASYTGTSGTQLVDCDFKPGWVLIKNVDTSNSWVILDTKRTNPDGVTASELFADLSAAEFTANSASLTNTGFNAFGTENRVGEKYIYLAIAEDAMAGDFVPTGELIADADPAGTSITLTNTTGDWTEEVGSTAAGPEKSGVGNFVSTNGTDTMFIENSNYEWCSTGRNGEEFFIKKLFTVLNANDPAHVAMQQAVAAAFDAFPTNVNARRTSIASSFYRLMAGETLSAEESAALTSTVRTAVNVVEPFALDGYYPLYYTAEAANAASSIGDHHTHDMEGDTFYMPDGGTIYHGTYLAPEEEAVAPTPAPTPTPTPTPRPNARPR